MSKKKNKKRVKVIHHYHDTPNPSSGNGVGPGRVTIETPGIDAETVKEIKTAASNFADRLAGLVQGWAKNGGVDRLGKNIESSLKAVQGVKAIPNAPIDVEVDDVSIDGTILRPDEFIFGEKNDIDGDKYTWIWRNEEDVAVHLTLRQNSLESTLTVHSTIIDYTIPEAEHLAQMLLSACAFRMETEYKEIYRKLILEIDDSSSHNGHVHVGDVVPDDVAQPMPYPPSGYDNFEDEDWDVKGVQG